MVEGTVKWFDNQKGYGFIQYNEDDEIFVHFTSIEQDGFKTLHENERVSFEVSEGIRGLQAAHVTKIN